MCASSARLSSAGGASSGRCGRADGACGIQPPWAAFSSWPPCQGAALEPLRPACASWMQTAVGGASCRALCSWSASAASVRSSHRPRQPGVMRPSGSTAVASMVNSAAPLLSRLPQCIRCQSVASPFCAAYWHMGATTIRLGSVRPPRGEGRCKGVNSRLMGQEARFYRPSCQSRMAGASQGYRLKGTTSWRCEPRPSMPRVITSPFFR